MPTRTVPDTAVVLDAQEPVASRSIVSNCTFWPGVKSWPACSWRVGIETVITCPAFADGAAGSAGMPTEAWPANVMPGTTVTVAVQELAGLNAEVARTVTGPGGGLQGAR